MDRRSSGMTGSFNSIGTVKKKATEDQKAQEKEGRDARDSWRDTRGGSDSRKKSISPAVIKTKRSIAAEKERTRQEEKAREAKSQTAKRVTGKRSLSFKTTTSSGDGSTDGDNDYSQPII